jgi:prophage antirepressor-like protein
MALEQAGEMEFLGKSLPYFEGPVARYVRAADLSKALGNGRRNGGVQEMIRRHRKEFENHIVNVPDQHERAQRGRPAKMFIDGGGVFLVACFARGKKAELLREWVATTLAETLRVGGMPAAEVRGYRQSMLERRRHERLARVLAVKA